MSKPPEFWDAAAVTGFEAAQGLFGISNEPFDLWGTGRAPVEPQCECGAAKALGIQNYAPGHSSWCAVSEIE